MINHTPALPGIATPTSCAANWSMKRMVFTLLGCLFVSIGFVGIFLPGIPTTGPLLAASFFLARGCPKLERRLLRWRVYRNAVEYIDGSRPWPMQSRIRVLACMWTSITISCIFLLAGHTQAILPLVITAVGLVGTLFILRFRRPGCLHNQNTSPA